MFILYNGNGNGSQEVRLIDQIHHVQTAVVKGQAARALRLGNESEWAAELERTSFELWDATNGFGDKFEVLYLRVPLDEYRKIESEADSYWVKTLYERIARAFEAVGNPIRFIGMDAVIGDMDTTPTEEATVTRPVKEEAKTRRGVWSPTGWKIEKPLGEGGQGWTYLVRRTDESDQTLYVAKRLKNKDRFARFQTEVNALQRLSHPGILRIIETRVSEDVPFYVAEYCANGDLSKADLSERMLLQKLHIYGEICDAVGAAHRAQIIHRDLKPSNVLVRSDASVVVGDFGLCASISLTSRNVSHRPLRPLERVTISHPSLRTGEPSIPGLRVMSILLESFSTTF